MQCGTRWDQILQPTPGTQDEKQLKRLWNLNGTFSLYARLRTQLSHRPLHKIQLHPECPEKPFVWPPVCSDDFYFEDAMRMAVRVEELRGRDGVKDLQKAIGIVMALQEDVYVDKWQELPVLPPCLKKEKLAQDLRQLKVRYIECFFHQFIMKNHPIDEAPKKALEIVHWLARENRHVYASYLHWVRMEILFKRALETASDEAMQHALCFAQRIKDDEMSPERALERTAYLSHFAALNFPGLSKASGECPEINPENEFRAHVLFQKIKPFRWEDEAEKENYIFTL